MTSWSVTWTRNGYSVELNVQAPRKAPFCEAEQPRPLGVRPPTRKAYAKNLGIDFEWHLTTRRHLIEA